MLWGPKTNKLRGTAGGRLKRTIELCIDCFIMVGMINILYNTEDLTDEKSLTSVCNAHITDFPCRMIEVFDGDCKILLTD